MPSVRELLPAFSAELQNLLLGEGRADLADQIQQLAIVARCTCGAPSCAHFYTVQPSAGFHWPDQAALHLDTETGTVVLDLVRERIVAIEVLDRPDVKAALDAVLPVVKADHENMLPCAACGFITVPESSYGSYNICQVCGWGDDALQLANPACGGGANSESLIEAQAVAVAEFPESVRQHDDRLRSAAWRPLNAYEIVVATAEREERVWRNGAVSMLHECYWMRHT